MSSSSSENEESSPKKTRVDQSGSTVLNWKEIKQKRKQDRRKWKEDKLLKQVEKMKEKESTEKQKKIQEEEDEHLKNTVGRNYTVSIALPGSILDNAQSPELRTYLAGQIARAAVVFNVDEIVIFDETGSISRTTEGEFHGVGRKGNANVQLARILQYLECPQYLRKSFFPQHKDLQYAGILNPLDCPHHMRSDEKSPYREGVVLQKPCKPGKGSFVNVGTVKELQIDKPLQAGLRVTVRMDNTYSGKKKLKGTVVSPLTPSSHAGLYWGYSVRLAKSLGAVLTECPHTNGYDLTIGTSDKGDEIDSFSMPKFSHALIVFGGLQGLESSLEADEALGVEDPSLLFNNYLNTCPNQGSRTIRTEEAILITMSTLRPQIEAANRR